ncbi:MAG: bifunctional homocysteine S-methyltransferase/methylenetetrahydrofolate reductase [Streptosporangiales bacterium]|nr:bifunctional homocysteine S-methyltransferase/methylenetetrahydrofolate reductase [Streptosporangiales bacterium]
MSEFVTELGQRVLVFDGAMGTMLHAAGNSLDRALPELNLSNGELVSTVHESYINAGVDIIQTNTFGANRLRLASHGCAESVRDINLAGVRIAREAQETAERPVFVAGSISPAVAASQRQLIGPDERTEAIREQVEALVEGGVDLLVFETFGHLDELVEAVRTAGEVGDVPIIAQATFTADGYTPGGESPHDVASTLAELPIVALGTNCTLGPQGMLAVVEKLHRYTGLPVSTQPNAGLPRRVQGRRFEYNIDGDYFARYARRYVEAGASVIGGCCGTTPTHVRAAVAEIAGLRWRRPRRAESSAAAAAAPTPTLAPRPTTDEVRGLAEQLAERRFVTAVEVAPSPGGAGDEAADVAAGLRDHGIGLFLVAARESARAQLSSISLALHLQQRLGVETIATATTWDKTIMTLQADLLGAHALGLRTVVCETGNPPLRGDYPNADGIWEVDSVGLIELLAGLNQGRDWSGLTLAAKTSFHIGARFKPSADDVDAEIAGTRAKVRAGAQFLVSRPVYETSGLRRIADALSDENVPMLLTISPLRSFEEAEYLAHEVPDVTIPEATLRAMERAGANGARTGLELATELLEQARPLVQGVVLGIPDDDAATLDYLRAAI